MTICGCDTVTGWAPVPWAPSDKISTNKDIKKRDRSLYNIYYLTLQQIFIFSSWVCPSTQVLIVMDVCGTNAAETPAQYTGIWNWWVPCAKKKKKKRLRVVVVSARNIIQQGSEVTVLVSYSNNCRKHSLEWYIQGVGSTFDWMCGLSVVSSKQTKKVADAFLKPLKLKDIHIYLFCLTVR